MTGKKYPINFFIGSLSIPDTAWNIILEIDSNYEDYLQVLRDQHGE